MSSIKYTAFREAQQIPKQLVEEIRDRFLEEANKSSDLYYNQDIERIRLNDWPIQRFLLVNRNRVEESLKALLNAMQWRKSFGVLDLKDSDFPIELYKSGCTITYGNDLNGAPILIVRGNINKKIKSWVPVMRKYFINHVEKIDANNTGNGLTLLMDCKKAGLKNVDTDALQFTTQVFKEYYPRLLSVTLIHKLPQILETAHKLVQSWLSDDEKRYLQLTNKKNIDQYISNDQLPDFMKGTNTKPYRDVPTIAPTAEELSKRLGLKEGKAEKLTKHFEQYYA